MTTVTPSYNLLFVVGALFTCFVGSHASLCLAAASIRLRLRRFTLLTGLSFSIQCIFALHFVAMCGIDLGVDWGFDIVLTAASVIVVAIFGTAAIAMATSMREDLEEHLKDGYPDMGAQPSLARYKKLLYLLLTQVAPLKLIFLSVLMATAAAGCHHLGMWSMRGMNDVLLMSELTWWSLLWTVALGGTCSILVVLTFAIVPEGIAVWPASFVLTASIAAFHFTSATYGMRYTVGVEGAAQNFPVGRESVFILIILQSSISQMISSFFSNYAVSQYNKAQDELRLANTLGQHIANMELNKARACNSEQPNPSDLSRVMGSIIDNLELYRPYLPDTLFTSSYSREDERPPELPAASPRASESERDGGFAPVSVITPSRGFMATDGRNSSSSDSSLSSSPSRRKASTAVTQRGQFATGLRKVKIVVLRIRLKLASSNSRLQPNEHLEKFLTRFMSVVVSEVKNHAGTVVSCAGGQAVGMWKTSSFDAALSCAFALQCTELPVVQVVQHSTFFVGNLAAHQSRSFNIAGPEDWYGQQLLRLSVSQGPSPVFVTDREKVAVALKCPCLPFELVKTDAGNTTVYIVQPPASELMNLDWMYHNAEEESTQLCMNDLQSCWRSYARGHYGHAQELLRSLQGVPGWYIRHLQCLFNHASLHNPMVPAKCLASLGWYASQVEEVVMPGHPL